ncbi:MAG: hypothetical protein LBT47_12830 [Deltaproteobacteria bacterium]|jgi:carbonic anhydrase|nr:hypothetical protein [Deltaproteobacteria bacterium]
MKNLLFQSSLLFNQDLVPNYLMFFIAVTFFTAALLLVSPTSALWAHEKAGNPNSIESTIQALRDGNARFAAGQPIHPNQTHEVRTRLSHGGQTPMAAVLACSDSRVPVEQIFDMGLGDLFVVRAAGSVPGVDQVGSIEYAVSHLGVPVVLVLSHTGCGAVTAAVEGAQEPGALGELLSKLSPISAAVKDLEGPRRLDTAVKLSAIVFREQLPLISPVINRAVRDGKLAVISGVYDIATGEANIDAGQWEKPAANDAPLPPPIPPAASQESQEAVDPSAQPSQEASGEELSAQPEEKTPGDQAELAAQPEEGAPGDQAELAAQPEEGAPGDQTQSQGSVPSPLTLVPLEGLPTGDQVQSSESSEPAGATDLTLPDQTNPNSSGY